jgi:hypothetical protein
MVRLGRSTVLVERDEESGWWLGKAQAATEKAARALVKLGVSRRDAVDLPGLSHQRVQQIAG